MTTSGSPSSAYSPTSTIGGRSPRLGINNTVATSIPSLLLIRQPVSVRRHFHRFLSRFSSHGGHNTTCAGGSKRGRSYTSVRVTATLFDTNRPQKVHRSGVLIPPHPSPPTAPPP